MSFFNRELPKRGPRFMGPLSDDRAFAEFEDDYVPEPIYPSRPPTVAELILELHNTKLKVKEQEQTIAEQNIKIQQQAETIKIHSKEMSKPHVDKGAVTPFRGYIQPGVSNMSSMNQQTPTVFNPATQTSHLARPNTIQTKWGPIPSNPPPAPQLPFSVPVTNPTSTALRPYTPLGQMMGLPGQMNNPNMDSRRNFDAIIAGTPRPLQPTIGTPTKTGKSTSSTRLTHDKEAPSTPDNRIQKHPAALGTAFLSPIHLISSTIVSDNQGPIHKIAIKWNELFDKTVRFAYTHLNTPSNLMDSKLPQDLKDKFMAAASSTTAARLLGKQDTRYLLIARVLIEWILRICFQPNILEGLDLDVDDAIDQEKYKLARTRPEDHRYVIIEQIQNCYEILTKNDQYEPFIQALSRSRTAEFLEFVRPLKWAGNTDHHQDALTIILLAHKLQALQLIESMEFRPYFSDIGEDFDNIRMINMDNVFGNMTGPEVMARKGTVKLTIVPQIMSKTNEEFGPTVTKVLVKGGVLLKFKDQMVADLAAQR